MKKICLSIIVLISGIASAQNLTDALRYSTDNMNGTARYKAMSGAFGALGGDFSAIGLNPAGSAVFSSSEFGLTFGDTSLKNKNMYFGTNTDNKSSNFSLSQFGVAFVFPTNPNSNWKKFTLGFNYQTTKNFNANDLVFSGTSNKSLGDYFLHFANGKRLADIEVVTANGETIQSVYRYLGNEFGYGHQQAFLGYQAAMVDPVTTNANETNYTTGVSSQATQSINISTEGGIRKYNFNIGTQYGENLYLGINLNSHTVDYLRVMQHAEKYSPAEANSLFRTELKTTGSGFSFQLGAIVKATDNLRLGASYESPTWYSLEDETLERLRASLYDNTSTLITEDISPNVINVYEKYKFRTPSSWTASVAYVFGKNAILSLDYIYKGYGNIYFRTDYLKAENEIIANELTDTNTIRLGGEYRFIFNQKNSLSLRAGYRYEQSPYKNTKFIGDLNGYSFGIGYAFSGLRFDVSYDVAKQTNQYQMYESVLTTPAKIDATRSNLLFTVSMKL